MTENELRDWPEFEHLPIFDDTDDGCETLYRYYDSEFDGTVQEAEDESQFQTLMADFLYVPKGAIRYSPTDVRAIFWRRRVSEPRGQE